MKAADPVRSTCERDFVVSALQKEVVSMKFFKSKKLSKHFKLVRHIKNKHLLQTGNFASCADKFTLKI